MVCSRKLQCIFPTFVPRASDHLTINKAGKYITNIGICHELGSESPSVVLSLALFETMAASKTSSVDISPTPVENGASPIIPKLSDRYADESYKLLSQVKVDAPTPEEAEIIRKKCVRRIIPFICVGYHLMYVDKQTVSIPLSTLHRNHGDSLLIPYWH